MYILMIVVTTLAVVVISFFAYSAWYLKRSRSVGIRIKLDNLHSVLLPLLNTPNPSYSVVKAIGSSEFLQFKNVDESGKRSLVFAFPSCDWSEKHYREVVAIYKNEYARFKTSDGTEFLDGSANEPMKFLFIDFLGDYLAAGEFSKKIFEDVFDYKNEFILASNNDF